MAFVRQFFQDKLHADLLWNGVSLAILGISGVLQNVVILYFYDIAVLGVFNQVFAVYIFWSQLAAGGIHVSAFRYVAEHACDRKVLGEVVRAALILATGFAFVAAGLFWLLRDYMAALLQSPGVAAGMACATPGLLLFAVNKVLLSVLNGERRMAEYAFYQTLRPLSFIVTLVLAAMLGCPGDALAAMFSVSEAIVFSGLMFSVRPHLAQWRAGWAGRWLRKHLNFGARSVVGGVLVEFNTRVDVLILGYVAADAVVGSYSFAAMIAEGFFQLIVVVRTNVNPIVVQYLYADRREGLDEFVSKWKRLTYFVMVPLGVVAIGLYPVGVEALRAIGVNAPESWGVFSILMSGILIGAGYLPFFNVLVNAGRPGLHTVLVGVIVLFNLAGNLWLVSVWRANGAACATGLSFVFGAVLMSYVARRAVGVSI